MTEEKIRFDPTAICEGCGKIGAFVYYTGDTFCMECMGITFEVILDYKYTDKSNE